MLGGSGEPAERPLRPCSDTAHTHNFTGDPPDESPTSHAHGRLAAVALLATVAAVTPAHAADTPLCHGKVPTLVGTAGDDTLTGTEGDDVIAGLDGGDRIAGLGR